MAVSTWTSGIRKKMAPPIIQQKTTVPPLGTSNEELQNLFTSAKPEGDSGAAQSVSTMGTAKTGPALTPLTQNIFSGFATQQQTPTSIQKTALPAGLSSAANQMGMTLQPPQNQPATNTGGLVINLPEVLPASKPSIGGQPSQEATKPLDINLPDPLTPKTAMGGKKLSSASGYDKWNDPDYIKSEADRFGVSEEEYLAMREGDEQTVIGEEKRGPNVFEPFGENVTITGDKTAEIPTEDLGLSTAPPPAEDEAAPTPAERAVTEALGLRRQQALGRSPVDRTIANQALNELGARQQAERDAMAQRAAQLGLSGGALQAAMANLDRQHGIEQSQLSGKLATGAQERAFDATGSLAREAQTQQTFEESQSRFQQNFAQDKAQYEDTQAWKEFEKAAQYGSVEDAAAAYKAATGKDISPEGLQSIRDLKNLPIQQFEETKRIQDRAENLQAANTLIAAGGEANIREAAAMLSETLGANFDPDKMIAEGKIDDLTTGMQLMSQLVTTYGDNYQEAMKAIETSGIDELLGLSMDDVKTAYDQMWLTSSPVYQVMHAVDDNTLGAIFPGMSAEDARANIAKLSIMGVMIFSEDGKIVLNTELLAQMIGEGFLKDGTAAVEEDLGIRGQSGFRFGSKEKEDAAWEEISEVFPNARKEQWVELWYPTKEEFGQVYKEAPSESRMKQNLDNEMLPDRVEDIEILDDLAMGQLGNGANKFTGKILTLDEGVKDVDVFEIVKIDGKSVPMINVKHSSSPTAWQGFYDDNGNSLKTDFKELIKKYPVVKIGGDWFEVTGNFSQQKVEDEPQPYRWSLQAIDKDGKTVWVPLYADAGEGAHIDPEVKPTREFGRNR